MGYLIAFLAVAVYGLWYAKDPLRWLKRRYGADEVPQTSITTARIVGIILAVIGAAGFLYSAVKLLCAG